MVEPARRLALAVESVGVEVTAEWHAPPEPRRVMVLGPGAGSGFDAPWLSALSRELVAAGYATLRFQYPYREAGRRRPDARRVLIDTVAAATARAQALEPGLALLAGGHSMSGRMVSIAAAEGALPSVRGVVCLAFPLAGKTAERTRHLPRVPVPSLFVQGTRDRLTPLEEFHAVFARLGARASLHVVEGADHGFQVLKRSGRTEAEVRSEVAATVCSWADYALNGKD